MTCVLVTITQARGSTPREAGAKMLVWDIGTTGTIGGGQLEYSAIEQARWLLATPSAPAPVLETVILGPDVGQCCGGQVRLSFERIADSARIDGATEDAACVFLFGAGHVGKAVVRALEPLPFRTTWIDSRGDIFPVEVAPSTSRRVSASPPTEVSAAPAGTFFLVMTHSHPLDLEICARVLRRDDFAYLGLIGSETKRARFSSRLRTIGIPTHAISHLTCPIGVPGIRSKEPAAIAAAVAAQLLIVAEQRQMQVAGPKLAASTG